MKLRTGIDIMSYLPFAAISLLAFGSRDDLPPRDATAMGPPGPLLICPLTRRAQGEQLVLVVVVVVVVAIALAL
jgi:hypothetical protein